MRKKLWRAYLYLDNNDYGRLELSLNTYVGDFVFGRHLRPTQISYLDWDLYVFNITKRGDDGVWDCYNVQKCAEYYPSRLFAITDKFTWDSLEKHTRNMVLLDQPNWPNIVRNYLEMK